MNTKDITVTNWVNEWLERRKFCVKESTYATYSNIIENHIIPYFSNEKMEDITFEKNQSFILYLSEYGRVNQSGGLSNKMIKDIMVLWHSIIDEAIKKQIVPHISRKYKYPKRTDSKKIKCLTPEQEKQILSILKKDLTLRNAGIILALSTGMRIGELCALKWEAIDLVNRTIHITQTLQRIYIKNKDGGFSKIIIGPPKSEKSVRIIPISVKIADILYPFRQESEVFFLTGSTKYTEPRVYREYYNRLMRENSTLFVSFHGLRHSFATRCIEAGCDYKTLSEILGHASVQTTMQLYVHTDLAKKRHYIEKMNIFLEM